MPKVDATKATAVYRLYDEAGALLYIGIAVDPKVRWSVHAAEKSWWAEVARRDVQWYTNRPDAETAEAAAISGEEPRYNVTHSKTRKPGDAKLEYLSKYAKPRQIRIAADTWIKFGQATKAAGTTRAAVICQFIRWYLRRPGATRPKRPPVGPWSRPDA